MKISDGLPSKIWSSAVDNIIMLFLHIQEGTIFTAWFSELDKATNRGISLLSIELIQDGEKYHKMMPNKVLCSLSDGIL